MYNFQFVKDDLQLLDALQSNLAAGENRFQCAEFVGRTTAEVQDRLQFIYLRSIQSAFNQFGIDGFYADLIEFVDRYGDVNHLIRRTDDLGDAGEYLAVVDMQTHADT